MTLDLSNKKLSQREINELTQTYKNGRIAGQKGDVFDAHAKAVKALKPLYRDAWVKGYFDGYNDYHETKHPNKYQQGDTKHDRKA